MSIQSRYLHTLVVRRLADDVPPAVDDYGQPVATASTIATVPGLVQPRRAREAALASQEGVVKGEHVGYLDPLAALDTDCWIEVDGARYDVMGVYNAGGVNHHLELDLKRVD